MEQQKHLFPVRIAYSAYESMAHCTVTVEGTTWDDLVGATVRNVGGPVPARQQTDAKKMTGSDREEASLNALMSLLADVWLPFWRPRKHADFHSESSSHVLSVSLIDNESLHIEIERAGRLLACGMVIYQAGAFRLVEASCKNVSITFESRPRDPLLERVLDVLDPGAHADHLM